MCYRNQPFLLLLTFITTFNYLGLWSLITILACCLFDFIVSQLRCSEEMFKANHSATRNGMKPCTTTPSGICFLQTTRLPFL